MRAATTDQEDRRCFTRTLRAKCTGTTGRCRWMSVQSVRRGLGRQKEGCKWSSRGVCLCGLGGRGLLKLGGLSLLQRYSREAGGGNAARHVQDECVYEYEGRWETRLVAAGNAVVVASSCSCFVGFGRRGDSVGQHEGTGFLAVTRFGAGEGGFTSIMVNKFQCKFAKKNNTGPCSVPFEPVPHLAPHVICQAFPLWPPKNEKIQTQSLKPQSGESRIARAVNRWPASTADYDRGCRA